MLLTLAPGDASSLLGGSTAVTISSARLISSLSTSRPRLRASRRDAARVAFVRLGRAFPRALPTLARVRLQRLSPIGNRRNRPAAAKNAADFFRSSTRAADFVMMNVTDPLGYGIVASLAHPEGNITGLVQDDSAEIAAKRMQLLKDAIPYVAHVAVLMDPDLQDQQSQWQQLERAALSLNVRLRQLVVRQPSELEAGFAAIGGDRPDAVFVINNPINFVHRRFIAELAAKSRLPMIAALREFTESGALMLWLGPG